MLERLYVSNYRSLVDTWIQFGQLTLVTGPNGSGKSNLYRALQLLQAAAVGRFSETLLAEGGMPSALWAGERKKEPVRVTFAAHWSDLTHELNAGLQQIASHNPFVLDPEIKEEYVYLSPKRSKSSTLLDRSKAFGWVVPKDGETLQVTSLNNAESMLSQVGEPGQFPELASLVHRMSGWRFYHQFDSGPASPLRRPQPGVRTDALVSDGHNLGAAMATLIERGNERALHEAVENAFPGYGAFVESDRGVFNVGLHAPGVRRPLSSLELSDGQLRFLCLAVALLSSRPPEMLVLNEPENSLHPRAIAALAPLIIEASQYSQVWVTTHDETLRDALSPHATVSELSISGGVTSVHPVEPD